MGISENTFRKCRFSFLLIYCSEEKTGKRCFAAGTMVEDFNGEGDHIFVYGGSKDRMMFKFILPKIQK
jgi:hypothetical protein